MEAMADWYLGQLAIGLLVFVRLISLLIAIPLMTQYLRIRMKFFLAAMLTLVILPSIASFDVAESQLFLNHPIFYAIAMAKELLVGSIIGLSINLILVGLQVGGELISNTTGLQMGSMASGQDSAPVPSVAALVGFLVAALMFAMGGHRLIISAILDSYQAMPVGTVEINDQMLELVVVQLSKGFVAGVKLAAPVVAILVLANLITGLIGRTLPQANLFVMGLNLNVFALFIALFLSIGSASWLFRVELIEAVQKLGQL